MATAGRILILPKGKWNSGATYEHLDLVAHNGRAWLAKKASVGIEPSDENAEFWHDFLGMDVFTEENPPTAAQVGAVALERLNSILTTSIKEKALTLGYGLHVFQLGGTSYTGDDLPDQMYTYSTAEVFVRTPGTSVQIRVWGYGGKPAITCYRSSSGWQDWTTEFIPLDAKPSGSYVGDGSTTKRIISTGGIGNVAVVVSKNGIAFVWSSGAKITDTSGTTSFTDRASLNSAKEIILDTDNAVLNADGVSYTWHVL